MRDQPLAALDRALRNPRTDSQDPFSAATPCSFQTRWMALSSSVQFSSVIQLCLTLCYPQGLQHARPPCPSPTPGVYSNSCPLSRWFHPTISSSVVPFSSCPQSFPESGSFPRSQFFISGDQSICHHGLAQVFSHLHFVSPLDFPLLSSLAQFTANQDMKKTETHSEFANLYLSSALLLLDPLMCYSEWGKGGEERNHPLHIRCPSRGFAGFPTQV